MASPESPVQWHIIILQNIAEASLGTCSLRIQKCSTSRQAPTKRHRFGWVRVRTAFTSLGQPGQLKLGFRNISHRHNMPSLLKDTTKCLSMTNNYLIYSYPVFSLCNWVVSLYNYNFHLIAYLKFAFPLRIRGRSALPIIPL